MDFAYIYLYLKLLTVLQVCKPWELNLLGLNFLSWQLKK